MGAWVTWTSSNIKHRELKSYKPLGSIRNIKLFLLIYISLIYSLTTLNTGTLKKQLPNWKLIIIKVGGLWDGSTGKGAFGLSSISGTPH